MYSAALVGPTRKMHSSAVVEGLGYGVAVFVQMCIFSLTFWYGGSLVAKEEMLLDQVLIVFLSIWLAAFGLMMAQFVFPEVALSRAAVAKVFAIIDRRPKARTLHLAGIQ